LDQYEIRNLDKTWMCLYEEILGREDVYRQSMPRTSKLLFAPAGCCYWLYFSPVSYPSACLDLLNKQIKKMKFHQSVIRVCKYCYRLFKFVYQIFQEHVCL
jgi:hypothetical protein